MDICTKLLVHAGAPSSRKEDEAYIAQAEAYLALHTTGRAKTTCMSGTAVRRPRAPDSFEYIDDTQLAYTALESQLFTSSTTQQQPLPAHSQASRSFSSAASDVANLWYDNDQQAGSSRVHDTAHVTQAAHCTPRTSHRPRAASAALSDSSYVTAPLSEPSSKRMRRISPECIDVQPGDRIREPEWQHQLAPTTSEQALNATCGHTGNEASAEGTIISDETTSELPTSYSVSDLISNSQSNSLQDRALHGRSNSDPGPLSHSLQENTWEPPSDGLQSQLHTAVVGQPTSHEATSSLDGAHTYADHLDVEAILERAQERVPHISIRKITHSGNVHHTRPHSDRPPTSEEPELLELAMEIHAPQPITSVEPFKTHVTKELRSLHDCFAARFRPALVTRQLFVHERGYWLLDCSSWRTSKKLAVWRHLETWIGNGSAGWGVWCTRSSDQHLVPRDSLGKAPSIANTKGPFRLLRVYCWGEIVGHVYILLYTASEGSVRKLGLHWIDSNGDVVVDMRASKE